MGQGSVSLNWGNLGQSVMFGAFGAGALYGSPLLPDPVKTIGMVAGIGLIGYAAYSFVGTAQNKSEIPAGKPTSIASSVDFSAITGQFLQPKSGSSIGFGWFSDSYQVEALLSNPGQVDVTVQLELAVTETPILFGVPLVASNEYVAASKTVVIPAGQNLTVDFSPSVKGSRWMWGQFGLSLVLRKIRVGGQTADLDHSSFTIVG